ncbi:hypothetical protein D3C81_315270 [compost metagenome]
MMIDMGKCDKWVAFAVKGILATPPVGLGLGPDVYLFQDPEKPNSGTSELFTAIEESFRSFGISDHSHLTLGKIKVLLIPMKDVSDNGIRIGLQCADLALSVFNKKTVMARARLINWHRRDGKAVGAFFENGKWLPLQSREPAHGPGLMFAPPTCLWDKFLHANLLGKLSPLGKALNNCMSWDREAQQTANVSHRLAFSWIGLESMLPSGEKDGPGAGKRLPILVGAPSSYYSKKIRESESLRDFLAANNNPQSRKWRTTIEAMYKYRCEVFHEGGTDFTSETTDALKADWYAKVADFLCDRLVTLGGMAFNENIESIEEFWDSFVLDYLLSTRNHWSRSGVFSGDRIIDYDWASGVLPEINHI